MQSNFLPASEIDDHYAVVKNCVAFIYESTEDPCNRDDKTGMVKAIGTGFLIAFPRWAGNERDLGMQWPILITNKHVLQNERNVFVDDMIVRMNSNDGTGAKCLKVTLNSNGPQQNVIGHPDDTVDLAAVIMPEFGGVNALCLDPY